MSWNYEQQKRWQVYGLEKLSLAMLELTTGWDQLPVRLRLAWERGVGGLAPSQMPSDSTIKLLKDIRAFFENPTDSDLPSEAIVSESLYGISPSRLAEVAGMIFELNNKFREQIAVSKVEGL